MKRISPLVWVSLGLVTLTISFMLAGQVFIDVAPPVDEHELNYRLAIAEALAVQFSELAARNETAAIEAGMYALVSRNDQVLSAGLVRSDGSLLASAGAHKLSWVQPPGAESTPNYIQVPIFDRDTHWGTLQVAFLESSVSASWLRFANPWVQFVAFVSVFGFVGYYVFMKRTLRELDPSVVVPKRVKAALDVLAEGVVLLDPNGVIMLVNAAFARHLGDQQSPLLGRTLAELPWRSSGSDSPPAFYPWATAIQEKKPQTGVALAMGQASREVKKFIVNSSPIIDEDGTVRGVLCSFDDVTALEEANTHLVGLVRELEASQTRMTSQNQELERLACRDPLTGCFNRHTFLAKLESEFASAREAQGELGCVLVDIDHLKSFNERYGHAVGDQVISIVARTLSASLRPKDILGRLGGEEFCVLLPGITLDRTHDVAERLRKAVQAEGGLAIQSTTGIHIAASFGISSVKCQAVDAFGLVGQAERAAQAAKRTGRDRVIRWDRMETDGSTSVSDAAPALPRQDSLAPTR